MWRRGDGTVKCPPLTTDVTETPDPESLLVLAVQRRRARRLGAALWLVVIAIVAVLFAWKLTSQ